MVIGLYLAAMQQSKLHGTFHNVVNLVESQQQKPRSGSLTFRLKKRVYRFFSSMDVMRSPASAQGTSRLIIFPSTRYLGMRAVMYVWHCHRSRCRQVRAGRKSYMGNFFPATVTSGFEKRTLTYMLSLASFFSNDSTCQSLSAGNSREANRSCTFAAMLQRYEVSLNWKHIHMLSALTFQIVNSH